MLKSMVINTIGAALFNVGLSVPVMASPLSDSFSDPKTEMPSKIWHNLSSLVSSPVNPSSPPSFIPSPLANQPLISARLPSMLLPAVNVVLIVRLVFESVAWIFFHEKRL